MSFLSQVDAKKWVSVLALEGSQTLTVLGLTVKPLGTFISLHFWFKLLINGSYSQRASGLTA